MKFKNYTYKDTGKKVVALPMTVKFVLSTQEMATQFTAKHHQDAVKAVTAKSEKEIIADIKEMLYCDGIEQADYVIGDNDLNDICNEVQSILEKRFVK